MQEPIDEPDDGAGPAEPTDASSACRNNAGKNSAGEGNSGATPQDGTLHDPAPQSATPAISAPRIWPVLVVAALSAGTFLFSSMVITVIALLVVHGEFHPRMMRGGDAMEAVSADRLGLLLLVIIPQIALVTPSLVAAVLSPQPWRQRLSLVRGHWPLWAWLGGAAATPLVGWISSIVVGSLMEESENLKAMSDIFREHGASGFLLPLAFLIGATPAICEEVLFRGYVQTRLNRRWGPAWGILISSAAFAGFHMDPMHVIAVFPLGLYLGILSWRSGSLIPAMLGHFVNNSIGVFAVALGPESLDQTPTPEMALFLLGVLLAGMFGAVLTAVAFWRLPAPGAVAPARQP